MKFTTSYSSLPASSSLSSAFRLFLHPASYVHKGWLVHVFVLVLLCIDHRRINWYTFTITTAVFFEKPDIKHSPHPHPLTIPLLPSVPLRLPPVLLLLCCSYAFIVLLSHRHLHSFSSIFSPSSSLLSPSSSRYHCQRHCPRCRH